MLLEEQASLSVAPILASDLTNDKTLNTILEVSSPKVNEEDDYQVINLEDEIDQSKIPM